ncbi:MAG: hypothetical protein KAW12_27065 [Candidatus Aminicenantes bacterium]|nr:hypothetical protein [Candidatus Aminicenantes bacterium]
MLFGDLNLSKVVLELKYDEGHLYWDKCGETIFDIQKKFPGWKWNGTSTELAKLKNLNKNIELEFNFSYIRFTQNEVDNLKRFKESTRLIAPLIAGKFKIKKFKRIGNRYQYVLPLENQDQGKKIVHDSPLVDIAEEKLALFGKNSKKFSFVVYIENENLHYRIELVGVERVELSKNIKLDERFNPRYGLRVDVDIANINEIELSSFNISDFIQKNKKFLENNLVDLIQK